MDVVIAGAHGQIGRRLARLLAARGDRVRGLIRDPGQADDLRADGAEPVVCDLEHTPAAGVGVALAGADAVVFAAGAGPGSGTARKLSMDRDGAVRLLEAATAAGVGRYVMLSAVGAQAPPEGDDAFSVYLQAKAAADLAVVAGKLPWTIIRPGRLTDEAGSGRVRLQAVPFHGEVPRDDVAAVLAAVLAEPGAAGRTLYLNAGPDPVDVALAAALAA